MRARFFFISILSVFFAFSTQAKADWAFDAINFATNYNAAGCSGIHSGMRCHDRSGPAPPTAEQLAIRARHERERSDISQVSLDALEAIQNVVSRSQVLLVEFGELPEPIEFPEESTHSLTCLRASIGSLFLLQENRLVFGEMGMWRNGTVTGERFFESYANIYTRRHVQQMYEHAFRLLGGSGDMLDALFMEEMDSLILSQMAPSFIQIAYLSDNFPLWNEQSSSVLNADVLQTMLSVGFRIGFFSQRDSAGGYPFTDLDCTVARSRLSHTEELLERVDGIVVDLQANGSNGLRVANVLPVAVREQLMQAPIVGSIDWLFSNAQQVGTHVGWLGARVFPVNDVVGHVPSARNGGVVVLSVDPGSLGLHRQRGGVAACGGGVVGDLVVASATARMERLNPRPLARLRWC
jgi:hypothetical protein